MTPFGSSYGSFAFSAVRKAFKFSEFIGFYEILNNRRNSKVGVQEQTDLVESRVQYTSDQLNFFVATAKDGPLNVGPLLSAGTRCLVRC